MYTCLILPAGILIQLHEPTVVRVPYIVNSYHKNGIQAKDLLKYYFTLFHKWPFFFFTRACRSSVVRMTTGNGMDVRGIESRWGRDFPHPCIPVLEPTQAPIKLGTWSVATGKAAGAWCWSPTPHQGPRLKKE